MCSACCPMYRINLLIGTMVSLLMGAGTERRRCTYLYDKVHICPLRGHIERVVGRTTAGRSLPIVAGQPFTRLGTGVSYITRRAWQGPSWS
jgi:hypothetical protein